MNHRCGRIVFVSLIVALLCFGVAVGIGSKTVPVARADSQATTFYVDDDTCPGTGSGTQGSPYCRIQVAVDAASAGDEILVASGTYGGPEQVVYTQFATVYSQTQVVFITRSLTLRGGYSASNWSAAPDPASNQTVIDAERSGRGVSLAWGGSPPSVTIDGFVITGGDYTGLGNPDGVPNWICRATGADCGGGVHVGSAGLRLLNSVITNNVASQDFGQGGGIYSWGGHDIHIENTTIISNSAPGSNGEGGGMFVTKIYDPLTILRSTFQDNSAHARGGGLVLASNMEHLVTIQETDFLSNTAQTQEAGGMYVQLVLNGGNLLMDRVRFHHNQAYDESAALHISAAGVSAPQAQLTNILLTDNRITDPTPASDDSLITVDGGSTWLNVALAHVTAADNRTPTFLYAEPRATFPARPVTVTLRNTLLVSFTNAYAAAGVHGGDVMISHTNSLSHSVGVWHLDLGNSPNFVVQNPLGGDPQLDTTYHLLGGSPAIDTGVDAGVLVDIDGQPRPQGDGPDIGADEAQGFRTYLPLALRNY